MKTTKLSISIVKDTTNRFYGFAVISGFNNFDLRKTLESGQCFRFYTQDGFYFVNSADKFAGMVQFEDNLYISCSLEEASYWANYFSLYDDYTPINNIIASNKFLIEAAEYSRGIRILKQDPWETLICFIISQRNNIPKIKNTVNKLCKLFGKSKILRIFDKSYLYYTFPTPNELMHLFKASEEQLKNYTIKLGLGYRTPYIMDAIEKVTSKSINLDTLKSGVCTYDYAIDKLQTIKGVGPKVANCTALFGLGHTSAFPVDIWIQRAIDDKFNGRLDTSKFGEYAGIIQQYIFYYMIKHKG